MENENIVTLQFKITRDKALLLLAFFFLVWHPHPLGSETLQLTTYYPAPYGGYVSLLTTSRTMIARDPLVAVGGVPANPSSLVGIGVDPAFGGPMAKLHVYGLGNEYPDLRVNGRIMTGDTNGNGGLYLSTARDGFVGNNGNNIGFRSNVMLATQGWHFKLNKATGNLGIGAEPDPLRKMYVVGDVRIGTSRTNSTGALHGLCHIQSFGSGTQTCDNGTIVTAVFGNECDTGGLLLQPNSVDMHGAGNWVQHRAQNCSGKMLCCRINAPEV